MGELAAGKVPIISKVPIVENVDVDTYANGNIHIMMMHVVVHTLSQSTFNLHLLGEEKSHQN
jgi:hypothetical protein